MNRHLPRNIMLKKKKSNKRHCGNIYGGTFIYARLNVQLAANL